MSGGALVELLMLFAVIILAVAAGLLIGVVLRRRRAAGPPAPRGPLATPGLGRPLASQPIPTVPPPPPGGAVRRARGPQPAPLGSAAGAPGAAAAGSSAGSATTTSPGLAVSVGATDRACPTCRTVYQDMVYCQKDARRLVTLDELGAPGRAPGLSCPRCGRSFEHGLRRCPHDGAELVPLAMYQASRRKRDTGPTGVLAKVCPVCRRRFDLSSRFCGRDGHELVVVN